MRISTDVRGVGLTGRSPLPPEECARRIDAATAVRGLRTAAPAGRVTPRGHLRLQRRITILTGYGAKPVLTGELWPDAGGTRFDLRYGGRFGDLAGFGCWFVPVLIVVALLIAGIPHAGAAPAKRS